MKRSCALGLVLVFPILLLGFCKLLDVTMVERAGLREFKLTRV